MGKTMHARLTTRQIEAGRIDEAIGIYRDTVVPAVSQQQGSKGGLVMTDRGMGKVMAISLWETEADLRAYEPSGATDALSKGAPVREVYEVGVEAQALEVREATGARVSYAQVQPGKIDEFNGFYRDSLLPVAEKERGFSGALVLTDQNTYKSVVITLWKADADMRASESFGDLQMQRSRLLDLITGSRVVEYYEVNLQM
jgi:heme-degrading monooxygenase HmoA